MARGNQCATGAHRPEIARLDALVQGYVTAPAAARVAARVAKVEQKRAEDGFLTKAKRVLLSPGTEIIYEKVETQITGPFRGYEPGTVLTLSNGQRWAVIDGQFWGPRSEENRARRVIIEPGGLGSFYLKIEGAGWPKVKYLSGP